jgi:hypothetical protein
MSAPAHAGPWDPANQNRARTTSSHAPEGVVAGPSTTDPRREHRCRPGMRVLEQREPVADALEWDVRDDLESPDRAESVVAVTASTRARIRIQVSARQPMPTVGAARTSITRTTRPMAGA